MLVAVSVSRFPTAPWGAGDYFLKPLAYLFIFIGFLRTFFDEPHHGLVLVFVGLILVTLVTRAEKYR